MTKKEQPYVADLMAMYKATFFELPSGMPLPECVGSTDATNLLFPTGHVSVMSSGAQRKLWPQAV
jgi:hypothetical protein